MARSYALITDYYNDDDETLPKPSRKRYGSLVKAFDACDHMSTVYPNASWDVVLIIGEHPGFSFVW